VGNSDGGSGVTGGGVWLLNDESEVAEMSSLAVASWEVIVGRVEGVDVKVVEVLPSEDTDELGGSGFINWGREIISILIKSSNAKSVGAGGGGSGQKEFVHFCVKV
jgi:hypothetical protein